MRKENNLIYFFNCVHNRYLNNINIFHIKNQMVIRFPLKQEVIDQYVLNISHMERSLEDIATEVRDKCL